MLWQEEAAVAAGAEDPLPGGTAGHGCRSDGGVDPGEKRHGPGCRLEADFDHAGEWRCGGDAALGLVSCSDQDVLVTLSASSQPEVLGQSTRYGRTRVSEVTGDVERRGVIGAGTGADVVLSGGGVSVGPVQAAAARTAARLVNMARLREAGRRSAPVCELLGRQRATGTPRGG
jgi:hypothetical protein